MIVTVVGLIVWFALTLWAVFAWGSAAHTVDHLNRENRQLREELEKAKPSADEIRAVVFRAIRLIADEDIRTWEEAKEVLTREGVIYP